MSIPVELDDLVAATGDYGFAYIITVTEAGTPHLVASTPRWDDDGASIAAGRTTLRNATARPSISLCFPPVEPGGYSLIVDGTASVAGEGTITFVPSGAVLHRPAAGVGATSGGAVEGCVSDCAPVPSRAAG